MKLIVVFCLVAVAVAAPPPRVNYSQDVQVAEYDNETQEDGSFKYKFILTDGTAAEQEARLINEGREDESIAVSGSFTWVGPDGVTYRVTYTADDQGYKPQIDQGPGGAVPPAVVASLLG